MVGFDVVRLASDQARTFNICRWSSCPNAESKNFAWRCQDGSLVKTISGESTDGIMPARKRAVSLGVTSAAAAAPSAFASNMAAAAARILKVRNILLATCGAGGRRGRGAGIVLFAEDEVDQKA